MLQQTKVETVRPYYDSWMERFPNIKSLAAASQDDVLRQWQGLGYYSRARNLHQAVQEVQAKYGGRVPDTKKEVRALKGVGDYTAGAILSLAYGKKEAAVDGNVLRIFARLYDIEENVLSTAVKKQVAALVEEQMPDDRPGAFNEALMDLGATICIPKHPRCEDCPLGDICLARLTARKVNCPCARSRKRHRSKRLPSSFPVTGRNGSSIAARPRAFWPRCGNFPTHRERGRTELTPSAACWPTRACAFPSTTVRPGR